MANRLQSVNRTTVELKLDSGDYYGRHWQSVNRTTVELKRLFLFQYQFRNKVLIELQ